MKSDQGLRQYQKIQENKSLIPKLLQTLIINTQERPDVLIDYHKKQINRLLGRTYIITGPAGVGKTSLVHFSLLKQSMTRIVSIDCNFDPKPQNIVAEMIEGLKQYIDCSEDKLEKNMVIDEQLNLKQLDNHLRKSHYNFIFLIKHAQRLVHNKRQVMLYSFLEWLKQWESEKKIGLVLISRQLDIIDKLQKRVKSRLNHTSITLFASNNVKSHKQMICTRFKTAYKNERKAVKDAIEVLQSCIMDNKQLDTRIQQSQRRRSQRPPFYLQTFKLILCGFKDWTPKRFHQATKKQIQNIINAGYDQSQNHIPSLIDKSMINLRNSNYPEYIVMGIIRIMIIDRKPTLTFKQILRQYKGMKTGTGAMQGSFNFPDKIMENAVKKLIKSRVICIAKDGRDYDFDNAELWSTLSPQSIHKSLSKIPHLPINIKQQLLR